MTSYLAREEAAHADDAQDVEDGRPHNGAHSHVTFGNENTWGGGVKLSQSTQMKVYYLTFTAAAAASEGVPVNTGAAEKRKPCLTYFNILLMVTSV